MERFQLTAADGAKLTVFRWGLRAEASAVVQLAHGAAEHLGRYDRLARALNRAGYAVIGADHRGHGANAFHGLGDFGPAGFAGLISDMRTVAEAARAASPRRPLVMLGHSMGSFAAQAFLAQHADLLDGLILSGTAAVDELLASGEMAAGLEACNAPFAPARTSFDWLSRDPAEVDAYIADPLCGTDPQLASIMTMPAVVSGVRRPERLASAVARQIPVYVISGEQDPITGPEQRNAWRVADSYMAAGLADVEHRVYPGGRHEMLNEINRDEVAADLVAWLDARF